MRLKPSVGTGTVLPGTKHVKTKKAVDRKRENQTSTTPPHRRVVREKSSVPPDTARPEQAPLAVIAPPPLTLTLSRAASDLVRWYCSISHHRHATTVDAVVSANLEAAKEAYENDMGDDSFNIVLMHVLDGDTMEPRLITDGTMESIHGDREAVSLLARYGLKLDCAIEDVAAAAVVWTLRRFLDDDPADTPERKSERIEFTLECCRASQRRHRAHHCA